MKKNEFVPVKKILNIINSCNSQEQINNCNLIINNYVRSVKKNGVVNYDESESRLTE